MLLPVMKVILFILMKIPKFWGDFGAGNDFLTNILRPGLISNDFLGVDLVESIDKGSIFGIGNSTNR